MHRTRKALANAVIQGGGQIITWGLTWYLLILLPRALGNVGFGELFYALSYGTIFSTLINLGINSYLMKQISILCPQPEHSPDEVARRNRESRALLGNALSLKVVLAVGVYVLQSLIIFLWTEDEIIRQAVLIIGLGTSFAGITPMFTGTFRGREQMTFPTVALIVEKAVVTGGCTVLLWRGYGLIAVCWIHCAGAFLQMAIQYMFLLRVQPFRPAWDRKLLKTIFIGGLPFLVWVVFSEIYIRIDVIMLEHLASKAEVGWYGIAFRLYATLFFLPTILLSSASPALMRMGAESTDSSLSRAAERLMNLLLFLAVPLGFGIIAISAPLISLLYGKDFANTVPILMIFGISIPLVCIDMIFGATLVAKGKERQWAIMAIIAAFFNPILNYWMIPYAALQWSNAGIGAAVATFLTEMLMMGGALWLMPAGIFTKRNIATGIKGSFFGVIMLALLRYWNIQNLLIIIPLGAAIYLPLALLFHVIPKQDLNHVLDALKSLLKRNHVASADIAQ